ncbi:bicyclomycin resistance protein [Rutstroemia sp. NJR-2017a WRK4]|nr:bicyclomycin resistance protein [Rutstroemia sp. NJR-2017a WRK4]
MCTPAAPEILNEFKTDNQLYVVILVSIWEAGEGIGPLFLGPLSELHGRLLSPQSYLAQASAGTCLYMAITLFGPIIGPIVAPIVGGYLTQAIGWRWNFWVIAIATGVFELFFILVFRETYKPAILKEKERTRTLYNDGLVHAPEIKNKALAASLMKASMIQPMRMLFLSPVILVLSIYMALVYGYLYVVPTTMTEVFDTNYHFPRGGSGLAFLGLGKFSLIPTATLS